MIIEIQMKCQRNENKFHHNFAGQEQKSNATLIVWALSVTVGLCARSFGQRFDLSPRPFTLRPERGTSRNRNTFEASLQENILLAGAGYSRVRQKRTEGREATCRDVFSGRESALI